MLLLVLDFNGLESDVVEFNIVGNLFGNTFEECQYLFVYIHKECV